MTLALLITAVGGAWAQTETPLLTIESKDYTSFKSGSKTFDDKVTVTFSDEVKNDGDDWGWYGAKGTASLLTVAGINGYTITSCKFYVAYDGPTNGYTIEGESPSVYLSNKNVYTDASQSVYIGTKGITKIEVYGTAPASALEPTVEVTTNAASEQDLFTEASFQMPAFDATADYELVRDMQDEANPVAFSGLPTNDEPIIVKKGDDGKYQPAEMLNIQLIDPLAAAEAQNIIAADGITIKVLVGNDSSLPIEYDQDNPITLEAFLADMKPGYYWIKAEPTDENSPYDGTVYSSEFTVVEQYDLLVKPANDFSKGKIESVTVGSGSVTIDANTGEATKTGITTETEVKIKAKRGYVIDKVEAKKAGPALKTLTVTAKQLNYVEGDTWQQAIERPENAGSGWRVQGDYIFNGGLTLFTNGGGSIYVYVRPGDTIDATKNYSLEAD